MARLSTLLLAPSLLLAVGLGACKKDSVQGPPDDDGNQPIVGQVTDQSVPDFSLADVNSTSPTFDTMVSPRDHLGAVSAWYFGHAT
jgi:hypothetical protein